MPNSWYLCKNCNLLTLNSNTPNPNHCASNKLHTWIRLIEYGPMNYICKHCGTVIQGVNTQTPNRNNCRNGTHITTHDWAKLGAVGIPPHILNYRCLNCGCRISSLKEPNRLGCPASSSHRWVKI